MKSKNFGNRITKSHLVFQVLEYKSQKYCKCQCRFTRWRPNLFSSPLLKCPDLFYVLFILLVFSPAVEPPKSGPGNCVVFLPCLRWYTEREAGITLLQINKSVANAQHVQLTKKKLTSIKQKLPKKLKAVNPRSKSWEKSVIWFVLFHMFTASSPIAF